MTDEQKKQLVRVGYSFNETMEMVELKRKGHSYGKIASVMKVSANTVRYQLIAYEKITGEVLPKNPAKNKGNFVGRKR